MGYTDPSEVIRYDTKGNRPRTLRRVCRGAPGRLPAGGGAHIPPARRRSGRRARAGGPDRRADAALSPGGVGGLRPPGLARAGPEYGEKGGAPPRPVGLRVRLFVQRGLLRGRLADRLPGPPAAPRRLPLFPSVRGGALRPHPADEHLLLGRPLLLPDAAGPGAAFPGAGRPLLCPLVPVHPPRRGAAAPAVLPGVAAAQAHPKGVSS